MGSESARLRLLDGDPPELLVHDEPGGCPYLPSETARLPMRLPIRPLGPEEMQRRLEAGDRRQGLLLYRPTCPTCRACEAIRLDAKSFTGSRTQRRIHQRGLRELRVSIGPTEVNHQRVALYNAHKHGRRLLGDGESIDAAGYAAFLVDSCADSFELRYHLGERLVGVAICDRASDGLSAVYTYYDPAVSRLSVGTFSIMEQLELCRRWGLRWLFLGLFVHGCQAMQYKARFVPHERLIDGHWTLVTEPPAPLGDGDGDGDDGDASSARWRDDA
jgi:arginyl-tRNA--protein-N-Asp/Glu arginylyltransferase